MADKNPLAPISVSELRLARSEASAEARWVSSSASSRRQESVFCERNRESLGVRSVPGGKEASKDAKARAASEPELSKSREKIASISIHFSNVAAREATYAHAAWRSPLLRSYRHYAIIL